MSERHLLMTADAVGGVWSYAIELATALRLHGWRTTLALLGPPPSDAQRRVAKGIQLIETGLQLDWLGRDAAEVVAAGTAIGRLTETLAADLVQFNQPALAAAPAGAVPRVIAVHSCVETWWHALEPGPAPAGLAWQTALVQAALDGGDAIVCPSHAFAQAICARYGVLPEVVHNGRTPLAAAPAAMHDCAFTAGRLWDRGKNVATLDRAAALLAIPFKAAGATAGPHGESIALDHLHPLGSVDQPTLARCLASRPVFASAARYEPFGLAVLEAALAGCPLILSDIATHRELWDGAATFVAADDARGFADAIEALIGDASARVAQGERARLRAARYTPARMATGMAALYARVPARVTARAAA